MYLNHKKLNHKSDKNTRCKNRRLQNECADQRQLTAYPVHKPTAAVKIHRWQSDYIIQAVKCTHSRVSECVEFNVPLDT